MKNKIGVIFVFLCVFIGLMSLGVNSETTTNKDFEVKVVDEKIEITNYIGNDKEVTIPSTINNLPVASIGVYAFE
jgi:hypothetical protein